MSLGGSIINPGKINTGFIERFRELVLDRKEKFVIVCGGGRPVRDYQQAASRLGVDAKGLDKIGIAGTMFNAELIKEVFGKTASRKTYQKPQKTRFGKVLVAGGWKPGCSTDKNAVLWAKEYKATKIFNLSNIDMVYDSDPRLNKKAKPVKIISWEEYRKKIADKWTPGMNTPFDPVASELAARYRMTVYVLNGRKLDRLEKALDNKEFKGTRIEP